MIHIAVGAATAMSTAQTQTEVCTQFVLQPAQLCINKKQAAQVTSAVFEFFELNVI